MAIYTQAYLKELAGNTYSVNGIKMKVREDGLFATFGGKMNFQQACRYLEDYFGYAPKSVRAKRFINTESGETLADDVYELLDYDRAEDEAIRAREEARLQAEREEEEASERFTNMSPYRRLIETDKALLKQVINRGINPFPGSKTAFNLILSFLETL